MQFKASWHHVCSAVAMAVAWGRERMELTGITAIGVDEIHWSAKRGFMTLVYQIAYSQGQRGRAEILPLVLPEKPGELDREPES
jgi:hypothetical protein